MADQEVLVVQMEQQILEVVVALFPVGRGLRGLSLHLLGVVLRDQAGDLGFCILGSVLWLHAAGIFHLLSLHRMHWVLLKFLVCESHLLSNQGILYLEAEAGLMDDSVIG